MEDIPVGKQYTATHRGVEYVNTATSHMQKVLLVEHATGSKPKSKHVYTYHNMWFIEIKPFDISYINPDWLK